MKKLMCVMILVAFLGSMIVMTGCFGGSSGAILGVALFVLAISASGGSAAGAFAANLREASLANDSITMIVQPLNNAGDDTGTAITIPGTSITFDAATNQFKADASIGVADGYNQYRVEVRAGAVKLVKGITFLKNAQKTGTVNATVNATSTAKVMIYDAWAATNSGTFGQFDYNLNLDAADIANVNTLAGSVNTELNTNPTNPNYAIQEAAAGTYADDISATPLPYSVMGYITAADGASGQSDATVYVYSGTDTTGEIVTHATSVNGNYTIDLPNGTYTLKPVKLNHTYSPETRQVTVNGDDVAGMNFQALIP